MIGYKVLGGLAFLSALIVGVHAAGGDPPHADGKFVQYGKMHEAIGRRQHQGRVALATLLEQPHFYGVAALEGLAGEATIRDGQLTVTRVDDQGRLQPGNAEAQARLLVGGYVPTWSEHRVEQFVAADAFDAQVAEIARAAGVDTAQPFVFTAEGAFGNVVLHVIHGACPLHARLHKIELPAGLRPYEATLEKVGGTMVGVYAPDAVGNVTHPDTAVHMHLVFDDPRTGKTVTAHVEQAEMLAGATVRVPK